MHIISECHGAS